MTSTNGTTTLRHAFWRMKCMAFYCDRGLADQLSEKLPLLASVLVAIFIKTHIVEAMTFFRTRVSLRKSIRFMMKEIARNSCLS